ncbi:lysophospholipid acyltransferase family protein [Amycolatopsis palatopharyngis]|uniref:lysophospholipid acyltransferase family protein n=1 Tax=Amycolatopsis palatopharyngis TaxID=187982 RepID=UPI000E257E1F
MLLLRRPRFRWVKLNVDAANPEKSPLTRTQAMRLGLRFPRRERGRWFGFAIDLIWPLLVLGARLRFRGTEHLPKDGGVLVASNHLSFADPVTMTAFCLAGGRVPRYLAKSELWSGRVVGSVMSSGKHIPVQRDAGARAAYLAYKAAVDAVRDGECVVVFPEAGFSTRDDGWPSEGKAGLAKVALTTGVPVVPVANWGTHHLLPPDAKLPKVFPRRSVTLVAGPPVDLSDLAGPRPTSSAVAEANARVMAAVTELLAEVRGESPPAA